MKAKPWWKAIYIEGVQGRKAEINIKIQDLYTSNGTMRETKHGGFLPLWYKLLGGIKHGRDGMKITLTLEIKTHIYLANKWHHKVCQCGRFLPLWYKLLDKLFDINSNMTEMGWRQHWYWNSRFIYLFIQWHYALPTFK